MSLDFTAMNGGNSGSSLFQGKETFLGVQSKQLKCLNGHQKLLEKKL